jgi:hypothetical protein
MRGQPFGHELQAWIRLARLDAEADVPRNVEIAPEFFA